VILKYARIKIGGRSNMSFPKREEIEIPILVELDAMGGEATTGDVYRRVARHFPQISAEELEQKLRSGDKKWPNLVRWAKLKLVQNDEVTSSGKGVWRITDKGRQRLAKKS
jgi:restriction endonuclease Mrr